jgi:hypothetical protein
MSARRPFWVLVILLAVLSTLDGCAHQQSCDCPQTVLGAAGEPGPAADHDAAGGMLLRTGAIQLGPGVGRNAWRWEGDGESGF